MKSWYGFLICIFLISGLINSQPVNQPTDGNHYFNTAFLSNYGAAESLLKEEGFQEYSFTTSDGIVLNGLLFVRPQARYIIISFCGFFPGRKEGMASLFKLIPNDCSLLLVDGRGHGKSCGRFFSNLCNYGKNEYQDVIAALRFVSTRCNTPIIIHGMCAGAFHAFHALIELEKQEDQLLKQIRGFICDSGLTSLLPSISAATYHAQKKILPRFLMQTLYPRDTKKEVMERYLYRSLAALSRAAGAGLKLLAVPILAPRHKTDNIIDKVSGINCPILFIHARNDAYTSFNRIQRAATNAQRPTCWWLDKAEHACIHLQHQDAYREHLAEFIDSI